MEQHPSPILVTRFMSRDEYAAYAKGQTVRNLASDRPLFFSPDAPHVAWQYLKGIVHTDICLVAECADPSLLRRHYAEYSVGPRLEYLVSRYDNETFRQVKVLTPDGFSYPQKIASADLVRQYRERGELDQLIQFLNRCPRRYKGK